MTKLAIKLHQMEIFLAVAELGSVTAAGEKLGRTPSAVSMALQRIEEQLGRSLFEGSNKSQLTPVGRFFQSVAAEELAAHERAMRAVQAMISNEIGRVDIATVPSVGVRYLPSVLRTFLRAHPRVALSVKDTDSGSIYAWVESGRIDLGISSYRDAKPSVQFEPLFQEPVGLVCARDHALARLDRPVTWDDLAEFVFIRNGTCDLITNPAFRVVLERCEIDVRNTASLLAMVAAGVGVTTLPRLTVPDDDERIRFVSIQGLENRRTVGIVTAAHRTLSPAAERLAELVRTEMRRPPADEGPRGKRIRRKAAER